MNDIFTYTLTETERLIFEGTPSDFQLSSRPEAGKQEKIAHYIGGKWKFDNHQERQLFLNLFDNNRKGFFKAFKNYQRSFKDRPKLYEFTCIRRKFHIKVVKLKATMWDRFYSTFYGK